MEGSLTTVLSLVRSQIKLLDKLMQASRKITREGRLDDFVLEITPLSIKFGKECFPA
jgi:hypothetical protein